MSTAAAAAGSAVLFLLFLWPLPSAVREPPVVDLPVPGDGERGTIARLGDHGGGVPADPHGLPLDEAVVVVQVEVFGVSGDRTVVCGGLSVVLADVLKVVELERPHRTGCELRLPEDLLDL